MSGNSLLSVKALRCMLGGQDDKPLFQDVDLELDEGQILVLQGRSGSGKTTLLKCLAHLNPFSGQVLLHGKSATEYGVPLYRTKVLYVPQRPSLLSSTPKAFLETVRSFVSYKGVSSSSDPIELAKTWGIDEYLWDREWSNLSGGETQRITLAVALGLGTSEVLLLDEPTSALDADTTSQVEKSIIDAVKSPRPPRAIICITHSEEQGHRIGTHLLDMETLIGGHTNGHETERA